MAGVAQQPGPPRSGRGKSNSHIVALLSLKILLLAFFILLNSLATFEDNRRTAVVDSVRQAFQGILPNQNNQSQRPAALEMLDGAKEAVDELRRLFSENLPIVERRESTDSWKLRLDMPVDDLFAADGDELMPEGVETLRVIAGVLSNERFGALNYRIDLLYGLSGGVSGFAGNEAALARAGALVRALERQGLPPARLSTGFLPDFAGQARFHFTIESDAPAAAERSGEEG